MTVLSVQPSYPVFTELNGDALESGYLWIGAANLDPQSNPITVYWDIALTQPAGQPIRTLAGYPANSGTPARLYVNSDYSIRVINKTGNVVYSALAATERYNGAVIQIDSADVDFTQSGTGAVATTIREKLQLGVDVSVFDFMTASQIAAVQAYLFVTDVTAACQAALAAAHAAKKNLYFPAGGYLVTGLIIPGVVDGIGTDDRDKGFRIYGQGFGEPFVHANTGGTVIKSITNAPVIEDILGTAASSNGTVEIDHIRFDGTSNATPVVRLQSFYGLSSFHNCVVYQRGTGDGLQLGWGATVSVRECYVMNKDWITFGLGAGRVGTGISYLPTADNGLITISKCTSRGWLTGYQLAGGAGAAYSACIDRCEGSVIYNGVILSSNADKCTVSGCYFEGGDGGVGVNNLGDYNSIRDNLFFAGFSTAIQDLSTSNKGTLIEGNLVGIGATVNGKGIVISSSAAFGGYSKNIINNSITYTLGTNGVKGIQFAGTSPRVTVLGNSFDPRGAWTGAGTIKYDDQSADEGPFGVITQENGEYEFPVLASGALSLFRSAAALTESNVSANILTLPNGSYFEVTATVATTVQRFSAGTLEGRVIIFRTTNANTTFTDTVYNQLAGGVSFTGPGTITFFVDKIGADNYAYELCRTVF